MGTLKVRLCIRVRLRAMWLKIVRGLKTSILEGSHVIHASNVLNGLPKKLRTKESEHMLGCGDGLGGSEPPNLRHVGLDGVVERDSCSSSRNWHRALRWSRR